MSIHKVVSCFLFDNQQKLSVVERLFDEKTVFYVQCEAVAEFIHQLFVGDNFGIRLLFDNIEFSLSFFLLEIDELGFESEFVSTGFKRKGDDTFGLDWSGKFNFLVGFPLLEVDCRRFQFNQTVS